MMKTRKIIALVALATTPFIGAAAMQSANAEPNNTPAPKASCTWNGATTSDGGYHTETSGTSWAKYKCVNGTWVKESSCDGNCNPPPPLTTPTTTKIPRVGVTGGAIRR